MFEDVEVNSKRWFDLTPLLNEEFRDIEGFEGLYQISNYGRVKSLEREVKHYNRFRVCNRKIISKVLKCCYDKDKYLIVTLNKDGKGHWKRIHQLIGYTFLGNNGNYVVNHKDLNKQNPRIDNLEICTPLENSKHAQINGATRKGRKLKAYNKEKEYIYNNVRDFANKNNISYDIARYYIYTKREWQGFKFEFLQ